MKKFTYEQSIIAARPEKFKVNRQFVFTTMQAVKEASSGKSFAASYLDSNQIIKKESIFMKLKRLPTTALVALIIASAILASGAVYAAVHFAPEFIKILNKKESSRGTTEYYVPEFEKCVDTEYQKTSTFELKKGAPELSDDEVTKIIKAKCELEIMNDFVKKTWTKEELNPAPSKNGITFAASHERPINFKNISDNKIHVYYDAEGDVYDYSYPISDDLPLRVYFEGKQISLDDIRNGDTVILVSKGVEEYNKDNSGLNIPEEYIGIIKLTLPFEYYEQKQAFLTDINECIGNPGENCPNTGYIDVFPGGEGMGGNYKLKIDESVKLREISGEVISLGSETLELKSSSGAIFSVQTPKNTFRDYNNIDAKNHLDGDASLKIGSRLNVRYYKPPGDSSNKIVTKEIEHIGLLIDAVDYKQEPLKQY